MSLSRGPKLLFLAWPFPPLNAPGCIRTWAFAKYLSRHGWNVTVVTPHASIWKRVDILDTIDDKLKQENIQRIDTGHQFRYLATNDLKCRNQKLGWLIGGIFRKVARRFAIDPAIGWNKAAEKSCSSLTAKDVDVILATGKPFTAFRLAERLASRLNRPFVLDYRDPWTSNPHAAYPARAATFREEARLLKGCSAATIVSPSWRAILEKRFGVGPKLHVITNGYDPEELETIEPYRFKHFSIVYTGVFYRTKRLISPVMAALSRLKDAYDETAHPWAFHYFGPSVDHVRTEAQRFGILDRVVFHGNVPRVDALSAICGANLAVVVTSVAENATMEDKGIVTSKVFEALGLGTRILSIAPSGSDIEVILKNDEMGQSFTGDDICGITSFIREAMVRVFDRPQETELYQWPQISKQLNAILQGVL